MGILAFAAPAQQTDDVPTPRLHHLVIPVPDVREAAGWYAAELGGTPTLYLHRRAVEFENGTLLVFEPADASRALRTPVAELGFVVPMSGQAETNPGPGSTQDPWGTPIALFHSESPRGLVHVSFYAPDSALALTRFSILAGHEPSALPHAPDRLGVQAGPAWIVVSPAPEQVNLAPLRLGLAVADFDLARRALERAGATVIAGPAKFSDVHILQVQLAPGIEVELVQPPPAQAP